MSYTKESLDEEKLKTNASYLFHFRNKRIQHGHNAVLESAQKKKPHTQIINVF